MAGKKQGGIRPSMYSLMSLGFEFAGILLIPAGFGYLLDRWLYDSGPGLFFLIFFMVGFLYGIYYLIRTGLNAMKTGFEEDIEEKPDTGTIEDRSREVSRALGDLGKKIEDLEKRRRPRK